MPYDYPTDPLVLAALTPDEWDELLERIYNDPPAWPWRFIAVAPTPISAKGEDRRAIVMELTRQGMTGHAIALHLGISDGLVSKIKNGKR